LSCGYPGTKHRHVGRMRNEDPVTPEKRNTLRCQFFPTPPLVFPKFPHVPLELDGWRLESEEQRCWANCPCNQFPRFPTYVITIHKRHRRTDRQTDGRHAISIPRYVGLHSASRGKKIVLNSNMAYTRGDRRRVCGSDYYWTLRLSIHSLSNVIASRSYRTVFVISRRFIGLDV